MIIKDLIENTDYINTLIGNDQSDISLLTLNSKEVKDGSCFTAIKGTMSNGHQYIDQAVNSGAKLVVCEILPNTLSNACAYLQVKDSKEALATISNTFYDYPSNHMNIIGVTGTNGKTTVANLCYQMLTSMGKKCGLLSTINNRIDRQTFTTTHTTLNPIDLNRMLNQMKKEQCEYVFMECSSHAIDQKRILGLDFNIGVFTNITHDHLDYHKTFYNYLATKQRFFSQLSSNAYAISNIDDKNGSIMLQNSKAKKVHYSLRGEGDINGKILDSDFIGTLLEINKKQVYCKLLGEFNAYNLLSVYAVGKCLKMDDDEVLTHLSNLKAIEGRFQIVLSKNTSKIGVVDYAHTPDGVKKILISVCKTKKSTQKIITIIGCGGDRDKAKRPIMAKIAGDISDHVFITSDNPRNEKPEDIIQDMMSDMLPSLKRKFSIVLDRKDAIEEAVQYASDADVIVLCGKGHEKYQDINGVKTPFDDVEILQQKLNNS